MTHDKIQESIEFQFRTHMANFLHQLSPLKNKIIHTKDEAPSLERQNAFIIDSNEESPFNSIHEEQLRFGGTRLSCWICGSGIEKAPLLAPCQHGQIPPDFELFVHSRCIESRLKIKNDRTLLSAIDRKPVQWENCPTCLHPYPFCAQPHTTASLRYLGNGCAIPSFPLMLAPKALLKSKYVIITTIFLAYLCYEAIHCTEMRRVPGSYISRNVNEDTAPDFIWLPIVLKTCWRNGWAGWLWKGIDSATFGNSAMVLIILFLIPICIKTLYQLCEFTIK